MNEIPTCTKIKSMDVNFDLGEWRSFQAFLIILYFKLKDVISTQFQSFDICLQQRDFKLCQIFLSEVTSWR